LLEPSPSPSPEPSPEPSPQPSPQPLLPLEPPPLLPPLPAPPSIADAAHILSLWASELAAAASTLAAAAGGANGTWTGAVTMGRRRLESAHRQAGSPPLTMGATAGLVAAVGALGSVLIAKHRRAGRGDVHHTAAAVRLDPAVSINV